MNFDGTRNTNLSMIYAPRVYYFSVCSSGV